jgi:heterodisulfide reductase subunit C
MAGSTVCTIGNRRVNVDEAIEELRPEYAFDYSKAAQGKYFKRLIEEGANVAVLEPEVAKVLTITAAVSN